MNRHDCIRHRHCHTCDHYWLNNNCRTCWNQNNHGNPYWNPCWGRPDGIWPTHPPCGHPPMPPIPEPDDSFDYGGRINNAAQTLTLAAATPLQVPLPSTLPNAGVTYVNPNAITINDPGDYEIAYAVNMDGAVLEEPVTLAVRNNDVIISNSTITATTPNISGITIRTLAPGDVIDLALTSATAQTLTLGTGTTASLIVRQLS